MPLGQKGIGPGQGRTHVFHAQARAVQGIGRDVHAHGRQGAAAHGHFAHPGDLADLLGQHRGRGIVELGAAQDVRGDGQDEDGRARRVHLAVGGVGRHGGQGGTGGVDGRLHVTGRAVDVPVQVELEDDARGAQAAAGGHLGHPGDAAQGPFQRRGHSGGHGLGAGPGHIGLHPDHGEVHFGQGRHGQQKKSHHARQGHGDGQQRGGHGPADEGRGKVQGDEFRPEALAPFSGQSQILPFMGVAALPAGCGGPGRLLRPAHDRPPRHGGPASRPDARTRYR